MLFIHSLTPFSISSDNAMPSRKKMDLHSNDVQTFLANAKAEFVTRVQVVRKKMQLREQEIHGTWLTEAKLIQKGYSAILGY